jgi:hypothetical protein
MHSHQLSHQKATELFQGSPIDSQFLFGIRKTIGLETLGFTFYKAKLSNLRENKYVSNAAYYVFELEELFYVGEPDVSHFPPLTQYTFSTLSGHRVSGHIPAFDPTPFIITFTPDILSLLTFFLPAFQAKLQELYKTKTEFETIKKLLPQLELKKDVPSKS